MDIHATTAGTTAATETVAPSSTDSSSDTWVRRTDRHRHTGPRSDDVPVAHQSASPHQPSSRDSVRHLLVRGVRSEVTLLPMNIPRSLALLATFIVAIAPCRADTDVAVSQLPRSVLKAVEARHPSSHILKAEWDHEGYYEIKVQDGQGRHLLHVRPKGKILKDEPD